MILLSSPAKTQDFDTKWSSVVKTEPEFLKEASKIVVQLKEMSVSQLAKVMSVSPKLAELNYDRYQKWTAADHLKSGKPAVLAYKGDIFKQMHPKKYTKDQQLYAQHSTRFLTGLYGMLRAYDLMLPYRLEMKAPVSIGTAKDLNHYWQKKITASLNRDLAAESKPLLVDAASGEYSKPIDFKQVSHPWVRIEFREKEGKKMRNVGLFSKKARGLLLEYCILNQVTSIDGLKKFNSEGYSFHSESDHELMFVR